MSNDKMGGPAFPDPARAHPDGHPDDAGKTAGTHGGMTLRDYFAAAALTGLLARSPLHRVAGAADAYDYADAMLAQRAERIREAEEDSKNRVKGDE